MANKPKRKRRKRKKQSARTNKLQRKWETQKARRRKQYKVGDRVSFKLLNGSRVSGKVIGVQKQYYTVIRKNKIYKVNRGSILYQIGHAIGATAGKIRGAVEATRAGYKTESEAEKLFERIKRRKRLEEIRRRYG